MAAELAALLERLAEMPLVVEEWTARFSERARTAKPGPAEFSLLEHVCHLRDIEREAFAVRIDRLLAEDEPHLPDVDGARLAAARDYLREDLAAALASFTTARRENLVKLRACAPAAWRRAGFQEGVGPVTLARVAQLMDAHDRSHLAELRDLHAHLNR